MNVDWSNLPQNLPEEVATYLANLGIEADVHASRGEFKLRKKINRINELLTIEQQSQILKLKELIKAKHFARKSQPEQRAIELSRFRGAQIAVAKEEMRMSSIDSFYDKVMQINEFKKWTNNIVSKMNYSFVQDVLIQRSYMTGQECFTFFRNSDNCFKVCYETHLNIEGNTFFSVFHYLLFSKVNDLRNEREANEVLQLKDYNDMVVFFYSRKFVFHKDVWRFHIGRHLEKVYIELFLQDSKAMEALKRTKGTTLALVDSRDNRWGIGLSFKDSRKMRRELWPGRNLLGDLITRVRVKLLGEY